MPPDPPCWQHRHDTIRNILHTRSVKAALRDFHFSLRHLNHLNHLAATQADSSLSHVASTSSAALGSLLDISLVISWSSDGLTPTRDPNPFRLAAAPTLRELRTLSLQVHDFKAIKVLQKSAGSLVELVKCRLDGRVYVLKSLVKGFARRNAAIQTPINETKLLQRQPAHDHHHTLLTPQLLAAFQTQNSVHVLMEYVPSGDFSELLMAASSCGPDYPGRASTGLLNEDWVLRYSVDMVQAIAWVHAQGFAHRDIKPGNFLLDRSGHLKLCDFSSAAPFSHFAASTRTPPAHPDRKVWAFYCSQPTGTCDYLSPEVLEAEEHRVLERQQQNDASSLDDFLGLQRSHPPATAASSTPQQAEQTPGMYGPEVDWWSFGVMLYEMRFGVLPFFADRMEETYEKIKGHTVSLRFDPNVHCSTALRLLIQGLLTHASRRLGRNSAQEVQQAGFYAASHVDWSTQWPLQPPFTPNANPSDSDGPSQPQPTAPHLHNDSMSVVSSLPSFSALYAGDPDDFPAFADSRELERSLPHPSDAAQSHPSAVQPPEEVRDEARSSVAGATVGIEASVVGGMTRSSSSPAVVLQASGSASTTLRDTSTSVAATLSPCVSRSAPRWSDCDTAFVGFSYLPPRDAFVPLSEPLQAAGQGDMSTAVSFEDLAKTESPGVWPTSTPLASTPFHRTSPAQSMAMLPTPPSFASSPIVAVEPTPVDKEAGKQRGAPAWAHTFVTPARKPSHMAMHDRFRQLQGPSTISEHDAASTPAVPPSPYPFPLASAVRNSQFTGGRKALNRRDLDRARSATPGGGSVGSDSRQSGGSNAVREISEREAWDEMMAAVQKSVRKKQPPLPAMAPTPASAARSTRLPRSSTDPQLSASKPAQPTRPGQPQRKPLQRLGAPRQPPARTARHDGDAIAPGFAAGREEAGAAKALVAPQAMVRVIAPESPSSLHGEGSLDSPRGGVLMAPYALDIDLYDSDGSNDSTEARRPLRHKKSARQLLIRAQERGTPTKPKRAQSPPLTEAFGSARSVAAVLEAAGARGSPPLFLGEGSMRSGASSRDASYEQSVELGATARARAMSIQRPCAHEAGKEGLSSSLGRSSVTFAPMAYVPVLGAIPPWQGSRESLVSSDAKDSSAAPRDAAKTRTIRRKDSGEMLSQYRRTKGMGRATSMLSLSDRAKADAEPVSRPDTAGSTVTVLSTSPPTVEEDDFILGHVERLVGGKAGRSVRRFSSVLSLKERERLPLPARLERPASQDGKPARAFGRFRSRITPSTLCEEPAEETDDTAKSLRTAKPKPAETKARRAGETLPRSFAVRAAAILPPSTITKRTAPTPAPDPAAAADVSLMTGLHSRHSALQGSLLGLEHRLARLKARLED